MGDTRVFVMASWSLTHDTICEDSVTPTLAPARLECENSLRGFKMWDNERSLSQYGRNILLLHHNGHLSWSSYFGAPTRRFCRFSLGPVITMSDNVSGPFQPATRPEGIYFTPNRCITPHPNGTNSMDSLVRNCFSDIPVSLPYRVCSSTRRYWNEIYKWFYAELIWNFTKSGQVLAEINTQYVKLARFI